MHSSQVNCFICQDSNSTKIKTKCLTLLTSSRGIIQLSVVSESMIPRADRVGDGLLQLYTLIVTNIPFYPVQPDTGKRQVSRASACSGRGWPWCPALYYLIYLITFSYLLTLFQFLYLLLLTILNYFFYSFSCVSWVYTQILVILHNITTQAGRSKYLQDHSVRTPLKSLTETRVNRKANEALNVAAILS